MGVIHTRAAAVLKLMDLYTEEAADIRKIHIYVTQGNRVLKKTEGCAVILEEPGMVELNIAIQGPGFQRKSILLKPSKENRTTYHYVWLQPKKGYPYALGTTFLTGASRLPRFELAVENREKPVKLLADYKQGTKTIQLANMPRELIGRTWLIAGEKSQKVQETFALSGMEEEKRWSYRLTECLKHDFKREDSRVLQLLPVETMNGRFHVGLAGVPREGMEIGVYQDGAHVRNIFLEYGKENFFEI